MGHRRQVTAVTRLPRWRRQKTRLLGRTLLTMLWGVDRCDFWHAIRYWIKLACRLVAQWMSVTASLDHLTEHSRFSVGGRWLDRKRRVTEAPSIFGRRVTLIFNASHVFVWTIVNTCVWYLIQHLASMIYIMVQWCTYSYCDVGKGKGWCRSTSALICDNSEIGTHLPSSIFLQIS